VSTRDWLSEWNRYARLLAEDEIADARAALVDTNGDGRELWFGLDVRDPSGRWVQALDWDDVDRHQPVERLDETNVLFGSGTGKARVQQQTTHDGIAYATKVGPNGWWLLLTGSTR
jgi:N-acetylneuraminic acid mutarotase